MERIQRKSNQLATFKVNKGSLSYFDDKRCILNVGINALLYGNTDINQLLWLIYKCIRNFRPDQFSYFGCVKYFVLKDRQILCTYINTKKVNTYIKRGLEISSDDSEKKTYKK